LLLTRNVNVDGAEFDVPTDDGTGRWIGERIRINNNVVLLLLRHRNG